MKRIQALLYLVAATLAPVGASAQEHAQATAALYQQLETRITAKSTVEVLSYFDRVDPGWAAAARRHLEQARPQKVLRRLGDHKPLYLRRAGEDAWRHARRHARLLRDHLV